MRLAIAVPEAHVSADVLNAGLEATTRLNENLVHEGEVPPFREAVHKVRWKPEPPGDECFDHAKVVLGRGWGDCDDLATWHAASLRQSGEDPRARAIVQKSGPNRWHAVVKRADGSIDDPSREAGMGRTNGVMGAKLPLMMHGTSVSGVGGSFIAMPQLALRPVRDTSGQVEAWQARADLPWHWAAGRSPTDIAMASLHASPVSDQSIAGACDGLVRLGEANEVDDDIIDRAAAVRDLCDGAEWEDLADEYGEVHATAAGHLIHGFFTTPVTSGFSPVVTGWEPSGVGWEPSGVGWEPSGVGYVLERVHGYSNEQLGLTEDGRPLPGARITPLMQHLSEVYMRYVRGEQPVENGGRPPPRGFTRAEVQAADLREKAYRATLDPGRLAARLRMFGQAESQAHQARREARQFGNVLKRGLSTAMPIAQAVLPMVPGLGTLASAALNMASPMLQDLLASGAHLPPQGFTPQGFAMPQNFGQAAQFAQRFPGFISPFG
jgi:hypothetical protein